MESASQYQGPIGNIQKEQSEPRLQLVRADSMSAPTLQVSLLGAFEVNHNSGALPVLPAGSQRLLAFLALRERSITRTVAAGTLWPEATESHAHANLRSAILRLIRVLSESIIVTFHDIRLADEIAVDVRRARDLAHRLLDDTAVLQGGDLDPAALSILSSQILPDWYDDWVLAEAEAWRQLRLHALEAMAAHLLARGRYGEAAGAAIAAIHGEPLRETAHAMLIHVHMAEGNQSEALEAFKSYRALLKAELGIEPTHQFLQSVPHMFKR